ncbi:MAG: acetolactate synthase small subunit [Deltaproteobacteria bacterium]|nr:acetolactate synthase small subunit [Deltaproteobacteria bacterium]
MDPEVRENTISILVNNKPDVLARIAGTFSGRGFNIESISANVTRNPAVTKIIITTLSNRETLTKLVKLLNRLLDVLEVEDLTGMESARREMVLVRLKTNEHQNARVLKAVERYGWKVISNEPEGFVLEVTGDREDIDRALTILEPLGMDDFTRTGTVALANGHG